MEYFLPTLSFDYGLEIIKGILTESGYKILFAMILPLYIAATLALVLTFVVLWCGHRRLRFQQPAPYVAVIVILVTVALASADSTGVNQNLTDRLQSGNDTLIRNPRSVLPVVIAQGILGKLFKGGSTLLATAAGYLGLSWLADILIEDRDREDLPTHWLVVLCSLPAMILLSILYGIYHFRICYEQRRRRESMGQDMARYLRRNYPREDPPLYLTTRESSANQTEIPLQDYDRDVAKITAREAKRNTRPEVEPHSSENRTESIRHAIFRH